MGVNQMKMQLKKRELDLDVYGEIFKLEFPTALRMVAFMDEIRLIITGESKKTDYDLSIELLVECGLPEEKAKTLYGQNIQEVIAVLDGKKKI